MHDLVEVELRDVLAMKPGIGKRLRDAFRLNDITTMEQLLAKTEGELMRCPNLGRLTVDALKDALAARGLHLDGGPSWRLPPRFWEDALNEQT